jgi:predicted DNA binding protein
MLRITFQTEQNGALSRLHREVAGSSTAIDSLLQTATNEWLAFLTISDPSGPPDATVESLPTVDLLHSQTYTENSRTFILLVRVVDDPCIVQTIAKHRAIPHDVRLRDDHLEGTVTVEDWDHLQTVADNIEAAHGRFNLISVNQAEHVGAILGSDQFKQATLRALPSEHLRTLEVAYRAGYFNVPQSASASDVAEELGVSQSTFSERFRRSVTSLLNVLFGD